MEIKTILFPTDFSEGSGAAATYALDLAGKYGAKLYVVHVIYDITRAAALYASTIDVEAIYVEMRAGAGEELKRYAAEVFGGCAEVEGALLRGTPYEEILSFARQKGVGLIVMGSHGRKGLDRVLFGSTASKVVKNAACPVLTVRVPA